MKVFARSCICRNFFVAGVQEQHVDQQISARVLDKYNISKG
jgi:hypothetical protein